MFALAFCLSALACGHGDLLFTLEPGAIVPLQPGDPVQLTLSTGTDHDASWLPDGSGIIYSAQRDDRLGDRCIQILPPTGGRAGRSVCSPSAHEEDSLNHYDLPAVSADGRLAYWRRSRPRFQHAALRYSEIVIGPLDDAGRAPAFIEIHFGNDVETLRWLGPDDLLVVLAGTTGVYPLVEGRDPTFFALPAHTSITTGPEPDFIYYSRTNDSRIWRVRISDGQTDTVWDFAPGNVDQVSVTAGRIVAVSGTRLLMVDLASGLQTQVNDSLAYRSPALSPDGRKLVAERGGDLWLWEIP